MISRSLAVKWQEEAEELATTKLQCKGEFHPDWHDVVSEILVNRAYDQGQQDVFAVQAMAKCVL